MHIATNQSFVYATEVIEGGKSKVLDIVISWLTFYAECEDAEDKLAAKIIESFKYTSNVNQIIIHLYDKKVEISHRSVKKPIALILQAVISEEPREVPGGPGTKQ